MRQLVLLLCAVAAVRASAESTAPSPTSWHATLALSDDAAEQYHLSWPGVQAQGQQVYHLESVREGTVFQGVYMVSTPAQASRIVAVRFRPSKRVAQHDPVCGAAAMCIGTVDMHDAASMLVIRVAPDQHEHAPDTTASKPTRVLRVCRTDRRDADACRRLRVPVPTTTEILGIDRDLIVYVALGVVVLIVVIIVVLLVRRMLSLVDASVTQPVTTPPSDTERGAVDPGYQKTFTLE